VLFERTSHDGFALRLKLIELSFSSLDEFPMQRLDGEFSGSSIDLLEYAQKALPKGFAPREQFHVRARGEVFVARIIRVAVFPFQSGRGIWLCRGLASIRGAIMLQPFEIGAFYSASPAES
jgi:hypothetical protein